MRVLILFTRQLAAMVRGGLPLIKSLGQLEEVFPRKDYKNVAREVAYGLEQGYSFHLLLQAYPRLFPQFYTRMVEAGENGDSLLPALDTLADYYNERELIKNRLARIMFYPVLLMAAALGSGLFALWHVVPTFSRLYAALGTAVPPATRGVFLAATIITPARLLVFFGLGIALVIVAFTAGTYLKWATLAKLPLVGTLFCYWFCRVTAMVTDSGHTLEQALIMASAVSGKGPAPLALDRLRKGDSLYVALKGSPGVLRSFVAQGEITGELPAALGRAAEYYQTRVEESLDDFQRLLEPTAVLVVGGLVALMLLLLMLPMLQLARGF
jgi:type IV pilus assembly protein PilC